MKSRSARAAVACLGLVACLCLPACGRDAIELAGTVERKALELAAPSSEVIVDIPVEEGARVAAGQVVVQLDTQVGEAELRAHEAALEAAQASLTEAQGVYQRQVNLRRSNVVAQQVLDSARRGRDEAIAAVRQHEARIAQAKKKLEDLTIRSHIAGEVDQLPFEVGERAPAGGVVAVVMADSQPWVRVWIPAHSVAKIRVGSAAEIEVEGVDRKLRGRVRYLARESAFTPHYALTERETAHLVFESRVVIEDAPETLRPGIPAWVTVKMDEVVAGAHSPRATPPARPEPAAETPSVEPDSGAAEGGETP